jgi:DNA-binding transcriptional MerR regulator
LASYTIESLARRAGSTPRNIRAYQDKGLLSPPRREGRHAFYGEEHLATVRLILQLLKRGYTLAAIRDLLDARTGGKGLDGILGVVTEATQAWSEEQPVVYTAAQLEKAFGRVENEPALLALVTELGLVEPHPDGLRVLSPRLLRVGAELNAAGVPLPEVLQQLRILRQAMEAIAGQFVKLTAEHIWSKFPRDPGGSTLPNAARLIRRLRPLAQAAVDAELARAMRVQASRYLEGIVGRGVAQPPRSPAASAPSPPAPRGRPAPPRRRSSGRSR